MNFRLAYVNLSYDGKLQFVESGFSVNFLRLCDFLFGFEKLEEKIVIAALIFNLWCQLKLSESTIFACVESL